MKSAIVFLILGALPLALYPFVLLGNIMSVAGQRSGNESLVLVLLSYAFYIGTTVYPIVYLLCAGFSIVAIRTKSDAAIRFAFAPVGYLMLLVGIVVVWSLAETGIASMREAQEQSNASQVAKCARPGLFDNGDGLITTGCGVLQVGKASTGVIAKTSEAHNWEFKVESSYRMTIVVKNDKKSCPMISVLDSGGKIAQGFEDRKPPLCLDGMITTAAFYFTPPSNGTYIVRVFTPKTPGRYVLNSQ